MEKAKNFQDLLIWQNAHQIVLSIYKITRNLPKEELFGLTSQIRRSSVSIAANIAEGFRRKTKADKARMMNIAQGSLEETTYYLILIQDLEYGKTELLQQKLVEVSKMLNAYYMKLIEK